MAFTVIGKWLTTICQLLPEPGILSNKFELICRGQLTKSEWRSGLNESRRLAWNHALGQGFSFSFYQICVTVFFLSFDIRGLPAYQPTHRLVLLLHEKGLEENSRRGRAGA